MQWSPEDLAVRRFLESGWDEVETLGRGARGPVVSIRRSSGTGSLSALKRSSHHEVQALKALSCCRNIVELQEAFLCNGQVLARLECMEGGSFRSYLRARPPGRVSEDVVRYVVGQVLEGLQDMHSEGWMHRDVKAENIGLSCELSGWGYRDCRVKLLDFDVATEMPSYGRLTEVIGTVENMAPEVFKGAYNELADIWSVGVITYEALYGYRPFNDANIDRVEEMVRNWQRYLLFPFDAAELPSNFIRLMLADPEERATASTIRGHRWLRPGGHIESQLPATGSGFPTATSSYRHHATSKSDGSKHDKLEVTCRSRSVKVSPVKLLGEAEDEIETSFGWDQADSPSGQDVETLSRLRQGLSMWTNSRFSLMDPAPPDKVQEPGGAVPRLTRFIPVTSAPLSGTEIRMPDMSRKAKVAGERAKAEAREDADAAAAQEEAAKAERADKWHQSYLQQVRDRTNEMLKAAAQLKTKEPAAPAEVPVATPPAPPAPPAPPVEASLRERPPTAEDDLNVDEPWKRQKSDDTEVRHLNLNHGLDKGFPRQLSPSQSLPHVPYLRDTEKPPESDVSLQHLKSTQTRAQELLQILSQASRTPRRARDPGQQVDPTVGFMPTPPPRPPVNPAPRRPTPRDAPDRVVAAIASAVDQGPTAEGSPLSWLACQKHRMDRLLLGLQSASDDIAVASGS